MKNKFKMMVAGLLCVGGLQPLETMAQERVLVEIRNVVVTNNPTSLTFDIYLSGNAAYLADIAANGANAGMQNVDVAFDVNFGTGPGISTAASTTTPILATSYGSSITSGALSLTTPSNLSGAMPADYDSRFKINLERVVSNTELTAMPAKVATMTVNYASSVVIGTPSQGAAIRLRTTTGGTGSKWSDFVGAVGQEIGASNSQVQALPVKLLDFTAVKTNDSRVQLNWATADEQNCDQFNVERSADGSFFFDVVAVMKAVGGSNIAMNYQTYDQSPLAGNNFYRLKIADNSGKVSYSNIRKVYFEGAKVTVYPTDNSKGVVYIALSEEYRKAEILLVDAVGRQLPVGVSRGENLCSMDIRGLQTGNYLVVIAVNGKRETFKIRYQPQ